MKRDTPPGASRRACFECGGLVGPDVPLPRQRCVSAAPRCAQTAGVDGASPGSRPVLGYSGKGVSRRRPGANHACRDRDAASPCGSNANRPCRDRVSAASLCGAGASRLRRDRDAASLCGLGANVCLRRDRNARASGAAPLRCAPSAVAGLCGRREVEAAGSCLDLGDVDSFSACFQPCMSPIDRHRLVSDVVDGRCTLHACVSTDSCVSGHGNSPGVGHVNSCMGIHANSRGASAHGNSRMERGREVLG